MLFVNRLVRRFTCQPGARPLLAFVLLIIIFPDVSRAQEQPRAVVVSEIDLVLDDLHDAASRADFARYFGIYAEDAIFLGTDATERWTVDEFKAYAKPSFDRGRGWTYLSTERHIYLSPDGSTAWFDEKLENANLGDTRGSGVLIRVGESWKVTQYNLAIPVPNELAGEFVETIRKSAKSDM